jgi:hypothetical protein
LKYDRKKKTSRHFKVKIKGSNRTRTIFNYFKNGKESVIAKALNTEEGRVALAMAMSIPIREELQKQRFMRGF